MGHSMEPWSPPRLQEAVGGRSISHSAECSWATTEMRLIQSGYTRIYPDHPRPSTTYTFGAPKLIIDLAWIRTTPGSLDLKIGPSPRGFRPPAGQLRSRTASSTRCSRASPFPSLASPSSPWIRWISWTLRPNPCWMQCRTRDHRVHPFALPMVKRRIPPHVKRRLSGMIFVQLGDFFPITIQTHSWMLAYSFSDNINNIKMGPMVINGILAYVFLFASIAGWWFGTFFIFHILGIIIPTD